jgi:phospholipase A2
VKPAFPEAVTDISLIRDVFTTETLIHKDLHDAQRYPEIHQVAEVRHGPSLCDSEKAYLAKRKLHVRDHFAKYMGLDPAEVHAEDIPVVAFGGSGGGYRAMLGMMGYSLEMKKSGLWDLITYTAGVSGACWTMAAYYTFAGASWEHVLEHCKTRLAPYHPLADEAIRMTLTAMNGPYNTLGPLVQKHYSHLHIVLMDLYSVFTTGYLFLHPSQEPEALRQPSDGNRGWYKWSSAHQWLADGGQPLPIMTAIRHERPWKDWVDKEHPFKDQDPSSKEHANTVDAWFQWFEMTPYEIGCDELEAWVPTWGFGRPFDLGKSTMQLPEQSLALLLGLCTSAPAGPLNSYLATIKRNLPSGSIGNAVHDLALKITHMWGKQKTEVFQQHHPLHACNEHNFMFHMTPVPKGQARPPGIENSPRIHLIDSGLDNNCPTYVLLRPEREVDIIINMDASSDVQEDSFQERVDQIGRRRGLHFQRRHDDLHPDPDTTNPDRFRGLYAQIYDGTLGHRPATVVDSYGHTVTNPPASVCHLDNTMIYMPLLPNERAVPGYDPSTAKFSGSYNLVWTPEQVETLVKTTAANFADGEPTIKQALMEVYEKKKARREGKV